ncbi:MAG: FHA domain-containing protein [Planctomycetales bacterium]|nr:FHA domain-containing protein [Planctomycetales bacterium]
MRLSDNDIADFMAGRATGSKARLVAAAIENDPDVANQAMLAPSDAFQDSLKWVFQHSSRSQKTMDDPLPPGTELESDEEIARVQAELRKHAESRKSQDREREQPFRPNIREPYPILIVCDDGQNTGEVIRIRDERFIIGRIEGDFQLPRDELISSRHVAITRQLVQGVARWVVTDLQSKNGLFVRVAKAPLSHKSEVLVGGGCYRLEIAQEGMSSTVGFLNDGLNDFGTRAFDGNVPVGSVVLSEVLSGGIGSRHVLSNDSYWIGSDSRCEICRSEDPFVSPRHAKLSRSSNGNWSIQHNNTVNGIWLRMPQIVLLAGKKCEFQIGEQRFRLRYGVAL